MPGGDRRRHPARSGDHHTHASVRRRRSCLGPIVSCHYCIHDKCSMVRCSSSRGSIIRKCIIIRNDFVNSSCSIIRNYCIIRNGSVNSRCHGSIISNYCNIIRNDSIRDSCSVDDNCFRAIRDKYGISTHPYYDGDRCWKGNTST